MPVNYKNDKDDSPLCDVTRHSLVPTPDYQSLFQSAPDPCLVLSPDLQVLSVNDSYLRATATSREGILGRGLFEVFLPVRNATVLDNLRASVDHVLQAGAADVMPVQNCAIPKPGATADEIVTRFWRISSTPVFGKNEKLAYIVLQIQDVTDFVLQRFDHPAGTAHDGGSDVNELQRADEQLAVQNEKLRESEQRFASFMFYLPAIAWIKDLDGKYVYVNSQTERVFPALYADIIGSTDFDLFPEETARHFKDTDQRVLAEGSIKTTEVLRQPDGTARYITVTKFALPGPDGSSSYVAGIGFDVTERLQAEEALRESEERFHAIFNLAAVGIAQVTIDGKLLLINEKLCDIIGYTIEELLSVTAFDISHPDDIERHMAELYRLLEGQIPDYSIEKRLIRKSGAIVWVHLTVTLVRGQSGQPEYLIAIVQDINERKRAEDALRESEEKFYKIFNLAPVGMTISTLNEGIIVDINESGERLSGYQRDEVIGRSVSELNVWKDPETRDQVLNEVLAAGIVRDREVTVIDKKGRDFWGLFSGVVIEIHGEKHLLTLLSDINDRKKAQEALKESEERFRLLAETAPVMIWEAGPDGRCTFLNRSWTEYTGMDLEPQKEKMIDGWTEGIHPDDLESCVSGFLSALKHRREFSMEYRLRRADGEYGWVVNTAVPRLTPNGQLLGYIGTCFDVTERKRVREALQHDKELLAQRVAERTEELSKTIVKLHEEIDERVRMAKALEAETSERLTVQAELREKELLLLHQTRLAAMGEMIGNIAHQWRQPLNLLGLLAQDLPMTYKSGKFSAEYLDGSVQKMLQAIKHMSQTINDFRNFFSPDKEKVDFRVVETITRTISLLEGSLKKEQIETRVVTTCDPVVNGYPNEFSQVVLNIISNAKDAIAIREVPNPMITIEIGTEEGRCVVTITDNAGGIPEEIIDKIFDPYFTTKGKDQGTGVGLYMSKTIIEKNMGGILSVRNVAGGAEFRIVI
jgi:PAS domain S-box-containing protein